MTENGTLRRIGGILILLCSLSAARARADVVNGLELFPILNQSTWEISIPEASVVKNQGKFPYCGLYAMSTFLELWGDTSHTGYVFPSLDVSYLSLGYNRAVGSPGRGTHPMWLAATTQIFGAIPDRAKFLGKGAWPMADWEKGNLQLIATTTTDPLLTGKYTYGNSREFTGPKFLSDAVGIDLRNFYGIVSNYKETYKKIELREDGNEQGPPPLRLGDLKTTALNMQALAQKIGGDTRMGVVTPDQLYQGVKAQLYARRPVYMAINAGMTQDKFRKYGVVTARNLVPVNQGFLGPHAVVAVAHCDKANSVDRICARFAPYMHQQQASECVAIQNSWGTTANDKGYFCLAPDAWKRVATAMLIEKNLVKTHQ